jgi:hypothetical protein
VLKDAAPKAMRERQFERICHVGFRGKSLKGKSQERNQGEINLEG